LFAIVKMLRHAYMLSLERRWQTGSRWREVSWGEAIRGKAAVSGWRSGMKKMAAGAVAVVLIGMMLRTYIANAAGALLYRPKAREMRRGEAMR